MSHSRRRKLPWHQRPRAWFRGWLYHVLGGEEEQPLTDDHGNHIGEMLPPVEQCKSIGVCVICGGQRPRCMLDDGERPLILTAEVGGVYLPLSGDPNPWAPCWSRQDAPRPGVHQGGSPMTERHNDPPGPGCLSAFATPFGTARHIPPTPRPAAAVVLWRPRIAAGRIALLAGAW